MHTIPELLAAVQAAYPDPEPMTVASRETGGYDVAGAFLRYVIDHGILTYSQCHDIGLNPHHSPRYPDTMLVAEALAMLNPELHPETSGWKYAALVITQSEQGHTAFAYRALERALTPVSTERTPPMAQPPVATIHDITTANGDTFTALESADLARLVYKRFGYDKGAAALAWCRLLQNHCTIDDFVALAHYHGEDIPRRSV